MIAVVGVVMIAWGWSLAAMHGISRSKALWLVGLNPLVYMHFVVGIHNDAPHGGTHHGRLRGGAVEASGGGWCSSPWPVPSKPIGLLALPFIGLIWAGTRQDSAPECCDGSTAG